MALRTAVLQGRVNDFARDLVVMALHTGKGGLRRAGVGIVAVRAFPLCHSGVDIRICRHGCMTGDAFTPRIAGQQGR